MTTVINIEVCYALPEKQIIAHVQLRPGSAVAEAIIASKLLDEFPEIDLRKNRVGIFGKLTSLDTGLREGDRVEIYRALIADPKEARRTRVSAKKRRQP
ncbi:MAG: RnfH family protein [Burkholderiales bacterium]